MAKSNETYTNATAIAKAIELLAGCGDDELLEKLGKVQTAYAKRKSNGKTDAELKADAEMLEAVYNAVPVGADNMAKASEIGAVIGATSQKVTPRLTALVTEGRIKTEKVKGAKMYWVDEG